MNSSSTTHETSSVRKRVFTTGEAADVCGVSQQTIIRCFDSGRLGGFRVPGSKFRRIPYDDLLKFMQANSIPTEAIEAPASAQPQLFVFNPEHRPLGFLSVGLGNHVRVEEFSDSHLFLAMWVIAEGCAAVMLVQDTSDHEALLNAMRAVTAESPRRVFVPTSAWQAVSTFPHLTLVDTSSDPAEVASTIQQALA